MIARYIKYIGLIFVSLLILSGCTTDPGTSQTNTGANTCYPPGGQPLRALFEQDPTFLIRSPAGDLNCSNCGVTRYIAVTTRNRVETVVRDVFNRLTNNVGYRRILGAVGTLFIVLYGLWIATGMTQFNTQSTYDVYIRLCKILAVFALTTNWNIFSTYVVQFFNSGSDDLIRIFYNAFTGQSIATGQAVAVGTFNELDITLDLLVNPRNIILIMALFTTGFSGALYGLLLLAGTLMYIAVIVKALYIYIFALLARTLLFATGPIFIIFLLFERTRALFDNWLRQIISFSLQPVFLFTVLGILNRIYVTFLQNVLSSNVGDIRVCYSTIAKETGSNVEYNWWNIMQFADRFQGVNPEIYSFMNLFAMLCFIIVAMIMWMMCNLSVELAVNITQGGVSVGSIGTPVEAIGSKIGGAMGGIASGSPLKSIGNLMGRAGGGTTPGPSGGSRPGLGGGSGATGGGSGAPPRSPRRSGPGRP